MTEAPSQVLVLDDELYLRKTLSRVLERAGYRVFTCGTAQEALALLQSQKFALMFLDLQLPDRNGIELLPELRRKYPNLPIVILTAHATLDAAIQAVRLGARDFLLKPVDPPALVSRIRDILALQPSPEWKRQIVGQIEDLLAKLRELEGMSDEGAATTAASTSSQAHPATFQYGPFQFELVTKYATVNGQLLPLSMGGFHYLLTLAHHAPEPVSVDRLVFEAQGFQASRAEAQEIARWHIHELRQVLEPQPQEPRYILTVRGIGYRLAA